MIFAAVRSESAAVPVVLCRAPVLCVAQPETLDVAPPNPAPEADSLHLTNDVIV